MNLLTCLYPTEALPTANFKQFSAGRIVFDTIHGWSSEFPLMVMEFWSGWFDNWDKPHSHQSTEGKA